jgi:regulator of sigma E protease
MTEFFLHSFNVLGHGLIGYVVPFLFVLTIVVFFHELGHFWVARRAGVKVLTFSLGFGPELVGFNDRHGTRWKLSAVPLGGYVKFFGDDTEASTPSADALANMTDEERKGSFHHKKVGPRAAIVAAGPIANFILAIVIFTCLFTFFGKPSTTARVDKIEANSAAAAAGFQVGDIVQSIDGSKIDTFTDMQRIVSTHAGDKLSFVVKRADSTVELDGTPELREVKDPFGNVHRIGVLGITRQTAAGDVLTERVDPATALWLGVKETWFVVDRTLAYIGGPIRRPNRDCADLRTGRNHGWIAWPDPAGRDSFHFNRAVEPVPGSAARWWAPSVLCSGGGARPPAVGTGPGDGVPNRARTGAYVDGVCHL